MKENYEMLYLWRFFIIVNANTHFFQTGMSGLLSQIRRYYDSIESANLQHTEMFYLCIIMDWK